MSISDSLKANRIIATADEVVIQRLVDHTERRFRWCDLSQVVAYKVDLLSFDQVRVSFHIGPDRSCEISEDDLGFSDLMGKANKTLKDFPELDAWKPSVVAEPFARSETTLWPPVTKLKQNHEMHRSDGPCLS